MEITYTIYNRNKDTSGEPTPQQVTGISKRTWVNTVAIRKLMPGYWSIDHIPSGMRMQTETTQAKASKLARYISDNIKALGLEADYQEANPTLTAVRRLAPAIRKWKKGKA